MDTCPMLLGYPEEIMSVKLPEATKAVGVLYM